MKIKIGYSQLTGVLSYVNTILSDKAVGDNLKNVIFSVSKDEVMVIGYSALTFCRTRLTALDGCEIDGVEEDWVFQIKAGELNKILSSYASLSKTTVEAVELSKLNERSIRLYIHEKAKDGVDDKFSQVSHFDLDDVPMQESVKKEIYTEFPSETDAVMCNELLVYIDSLFPIMSNDSSSSMTSKLNFSEEYVFVVSSHVNSFFKNELPESFKGLTLGYSSVNFLKRLCLNVDSVNVKRVDRYLCIHSGNTEAFLKYQMVNIKTDPYVKSMNTDNGVVLDRTYFKDVLKRMNISAQNGSVRMVEDGMEISNENFSQIIPINNKKGNVDDLKFKMSVPVMVNTIIGDDSLFPEDIFIYFVKSGAGYRVYVMDSTGAWFSVVQVRV